jgi:hypothetical protein
LRGNVQQEQQILWRLRNERLGCEPKGDHYVIRVTGTALPVLGRNLLQKFPPPMGEALLHHFDLPIAGTTRRAV